MYVFHSDSTGEGNIMNQNCHFIYNQYTILLEKLSRLFNKGNYSFQEFYTHAETFETFHKDFHLNKVNIEQYLNEGLLEGVLDPMQMVWGTDPLENLFNRVLGENYDFIELFEDYRKDIAKFKTVENILLCLKDENGDYLLYLDQFKTSKCKSELKIKVEMKTNFDELKRKALGFFVKIWNKLREIDFLVAPSEVVLDYIREGKCFEIIWCVNENMIERISGTAPHSHGPFERQNITRVWIDEECVYNDEIHGKNNMKEVRVIFLFQ